MRVDFKRSDNCAQPPNAHLQNLDLIAIELNIFRSTHSVFSFEMVDIFYFSTFRKKSNGFKNPRGKRTVIMVVPPVQFDQDSYAHAKQTVLRMNEKKKETEIKRRGEMHGILGIHEQFHRIEVTLRTAGLRPGRENAIVDQVKDLESQCMTYVEEMETEAEMFYTLQKETLRKKMEKMQLLMDEATHSKKKVEECHAIEIKELEKSMQVAHYKAREDMKVERVMLKEQHQVKYTT